MHGQTVSVRLWAAGAALVLALSGAMTVRAEEIKGRWRFDIQIGTVSSNGKIETNADSFQTLRRGEDIPLQVVDPRNLGYNTELDGQGRIEFHAAYGLWGGRSSELLLDVGAGYYQLKVKDIEMSYAFDASNPSYYTGGGPTPGCETRLARGLNGAELDGCTWWDAASQQLYRGTIRGGLTQVQQPLSSLYWTIEPISGGTIDAYPVTASLLLRLRPTKRFNPFFGAGVGYLFTAFDESSRWREVSDELEGSLVSDVITSPNRAGIGERSLAEFQGVAYDLNNDGTNDRVEVLQLGHRLQRPEISTPSTAFLEARGGFELQFSPRWAFIGEVKFDFFATFPDEQTSVDPRAFPDGGLPAYIINGGLRQPAFDPTSPVGGPIPGQEGLNGQPGQYYVNGGTMKYGGWVFTIGVRYTL